VTVVTVGNLAVASLASASALGRACAYDVARPGVLRRSLISLEVQKATALPRASAASLETRRRSIAETRSAIQAYCARFALQLERDCNASGGVVRAPLVALVLILDDDKRFGRTFFRRLQELVCVQANRRTSAVAAVEATRVLAMEAGGRGQGWGMAGRQRVAWRSGRRWWQI
jgi:hypothetical protein